MRLRNPEQSSGPRQPLACIIVGNIYEPQSGLPEEYKFLLGLLNDGIERNIADLRCSPADMHGAFQGSEAEYLCRDIEPTFAGARAIALLFEDSSEIGSPLMLTEMLNKRHIRT